MQNASYLPKVKEQYEHFPYPPRQPQEEWQRLITRDTDCLDAINHYGFGGRRNFHKNFRVLSAGGGTGDALLFLAEQLRDTQAEVVYLDLSGASMEIAKVRAQIRGLTNIRWVQGSLLDLPNLQLGTFDYINCVGVLHHLASPEAGLAALKSVLAEDGLMGLMVYGKYGRTAIYQIQELMRLLAGGDDAATRLDVCKRLIARLPKTNWLAHSHAWFGDFNMGDSGLYDLLLHSQDRAYSIPELYDYVESVGLALTEFVGLNTCDPLLYIQDPALIQRIKALPPRRQYAIGELLAGNVIKHSFYVSREALPPASPDDEDMVPVLPLASDQAVYGQLRSMVEQAGQTIGFTTSNGCTVQFAVYPALAAVVRQIDGVTCLGDIYRKAAALGSFAPGDLQRAFKEVYEAMNSKQFMFLRHKDVPPYLTGREIQNRFLQTKA